MRTELCVYDRKSSRVGAERLCLFPCLSPRPFPHDFTTKAWPAPDGDPRVQCLSLSEHLCQRHRHTRRCRHGAVLPGNQGHQLLNSIIPLTSQTLHKTDPSLRPPRSCSPALLSDQSWSHLSSSNTEVLSAHNSDRTGPPMMSLSLYCMYINIYVYWLSDEALTRPHRLALYCWTTVSVSIRVESFKRKHCTSFPLFSF